MKKLGKNNVVETNTIQAYMSGCGCPCGCACNNWYWPANADYSTMQSGNALMPVELPS